MSKTLRLLVVSAGFAFAYFSPATGVSASPLQEEESSATVSQRGQSEVGSVHIKIAAQNPELGRLREGADVVVESGLFARDSETTGVLYLTNLQDLTCENRDELKSSADEEFIMRLMFNWEDENDPVKAERVAYRVQVPVGTVFGVRPGTVSIAMKDGFAEGSFTFSDQQVEASGTFRVPVCP